MMKGDFTCEIVQGERVVQLVVGTFARHIPRLYLHNKALVFLWLYRYIILHRSPTLSVGPAKFVDLGLDGLKEPT